MRIRVVVCLGFAALCCATSALARDGAAEACARPEAGSNVAEPLDLRSRDGVLKVAFAYRESVTKSGKVRYCYLYQNRVESPTLRLKPGDLLVLTLKNQAKRPTKEAPPAMAQMRMAISSPCASGVMTSESTNLHFHGISVPPTCHEDDVLRTVVGPGDAPFEYRFRIPADEPPGLYWYHPHVHGLTKAQVMGGASGALIVEGIERANTLLAGMPERVLVIRDEQLRNPNAAPAKTSAVPPIVLKDAEGDILNTGTGGGKPALDLSVNFVPVPFPDYPPAVIEMRPQTREFWRVLNAGALTYLDLQMLMGNQVAMLGVVSLDGVPINENGTTGNRVLWESHVLLPPAGRVEFVVRPMAEGTKASLVTRTVDTGPLGENDPTRPLANIVVAATAPQLPQLAAKPEPLPPSGKVWLGDVKPVRERKLYFSEQPHDPKDPNSPTDFFITVEGQEPKVYDPSSTMPNIVVRQGDVEDWIIENRSRELHAFHIHQIRFMLVEWNGVPVYEPFLRDTINVPYWDGSSPQYPSVKLRMDFRDPNIAGTFVYHCHLLDHEDGGMMGTIRVDPAPPK
jgi:FtsP/CotA-like multicopper oxidase with cupredoxin domain